MVYLVHSYTTATSKRWYLWEIDLRFALNSTPGWACGDASGCEEGSRWSEVNEGICICMGVDQRNHRFAPGLPPGGCTRWSEVNEGFTRVSVLKLLGLYCAYQPTPPHQKLRVPAIDGHWNLQGYLAHKKTPTP